MSLFNLYDDEVKLEDLKQLIENQTCEKSTIEYKLAINLDGDENKKEFLADIVSFANTNGGVIIYGIREDAGLPVELVGISSDNYDILKGRLESIIRDGISPKLNGIKVVDISLKSGKKVIVIKIPRSWSSPHLVWYKRSSKFYARNSSHGKYQLEVSEIRSQMLTTEDLQEKMRDFRFDRISKILNGEVPVQISDNPAFVLHLIPLSSFYDLNKVTADKFNSIMHTINPLTDYKKEYNFNGMIAHNKFDNSLPADQYIQIFRNGILEIVNTDFTSNKEGVKYVRSYFEIFYLDKIMSFIELIKFLGYNFPLVVILSVLSIKGYKFNLSDAHSFRVFNLPIKEGNLLIPDILLENDSDINDHLKNLFDPIWNACGFPHSLNYNPNGTRKFT